MKKKPKIEAIFYLTKYCNLNCTYCYKGDQKNKRILSKNRLKIILKELSYLEMDTFYMRIRGGEFSLIPETLNLLKELVPFLKKLKTRGIKVVIKYSTNLAGTLDFFKEWNTIIKEAGIDADIDFSIHSEYYNTLYKNVDWLTYKINSIVEHFPKAKYRTVFDNFDYDEVSKEDILNKFGHLKTDFKFSNNYGLFLDRKYDLKMVFDEHLSPLINDKRIPLTKIKKYVPKYK